MSNEDKLKEIIFSILQVDEEQITPGTKIQEDLGADSLDVVELEMEVEEQFDLDIPDECAEKFITVQDVLDYLDPKVRR